MSIFKKALASMGIGSAKVDTVLECSSLQPGSEVTGNINIYGGKVEQKIDKIKFHVMTKYERETEDSSYMQDIKLQTITIDIHKTIEPNEHEIIPFSFILDLRTPVTTHHSPIWIRTELGVENAIDPSDKDYIDVSPHYFVDIILEALGNLGFSLKQIENEHVHFNYFGLPFVQEFEFYPSGEYRNYFSELEMIFFLNENGVEIKVEVDKKVRGIKSFFAEMVDMNEIKGKIFFSANELDQGIDFITKRLEMILDNYTR